ncbi:hypothetical protein S83_008512, partial [Arachis hypogaea]
VFIDAMFLVFVFLLKIDWLNRFLPYLVKILKYKIDYVEFETLTLGCLPPAFQELDIDTFIEMKVYVTDVKEFI